MDTRAYIGIKNNNETITVIYLHNADKHISFSKFLQKFITTEDAVREILSYGEISSLCSKADYDYFIDKFRSKINEWKQLKTAKNVFIRKVNYPSKAITISIDDCVKNKIGTTYMFDSQKNKWYYTAKNGIKLLDYKNI